MRLEESKSLGEHAPENMISPVRMTRFAALVLFCAWPLAAQEQGSDVGKPGGREQHRSLVTRAYTRNLQAHVGNTNVLVLRGLIADKSKQRVEVMVESTSLNQNASCEFLLISEASDHAYEALLVSFAKPSDIHRALQFLGTQPGAPFDPELLRFWAKGEPFALTIFRTNEPPQSLENLLWDRRTGQPLPEIAFLFTGSKLAPSLQDPKAKVYAADEYQPKAVVSLFNSSESVLEVPGSAAKEAVYQNTILNPAKRLPPGALLTLVIEPVNKDGRKRVKDLLLQVEGGHSPLDKSLKGMERVGSLKLQLKDGETVLNREPNVISVIETLATLDRKTHDYYLKVSLGSELELGQAQALASVLTTLDTEKGIRIDPPPEGQIYYRAFTPDPELLDRATRVFHPWELFLTENDGQLSGKLLIVESIWKPGASASELRITSLPVSTPEALRREMEIEAERSRKTGQPAKFPVLMVFAPSALRYGRLMQFLEPVLPTHKTIHVYLDQALPPASRELHQ